MKLFFVTLLLLGSFLSYSQDTMVTWKGEIMIVNILKKSSSEVEYSYPNETMINVISISLIKEIKYSSGRKESFQAVEVKDPKITLVFSGGIGVITNPIVKVYLDNKLLGESNFKSGFHYTEDVSVGNHLVIVNLTGRKTEFNIEVLKERDYRLTYSYNRTWGKFELSNVEEVLWVR